VCHPSFARYAAEPFQAYEKGNISRHVSLLKIGDKLKIKGPKGKFVYTPDLSRELGMIAGGTGITPMLQIIRAALKNPADKTKISLIYANVNPEDILLKAELDELASAHPTRFTVFYVLNNPLPVGLVVPGSSPRTRLRSTSQAASHDIKVLLCGTNFSSQVAQMLTPITRQVLLR
jgi:cytochrome-b5 reductase